MAAARPMLGDVELALVQSIQAQDDQVLAQHDVPGLEGDFLQRLARRGARFTLAGVLTGAEAGAGLKTLRDKFRAAAPISFVADISTATEVGEVLIEEMSVREVAGKPERFAYRFALREYITPPAVTTDTLPPSEVDEAVAEDGDQQASEQVAEIDEEVGELQVQVILSGEEQDYTDLVVLVQGTTAAGEETYFTIEEQTDGVYSRQNVPAGDYTAQVVRR